MSYMQFLTWNTKIMKNKYCAEFLVYFCEVEGVWKVSEGDKPLVTHSRFVRSDVLEWGWCKNNPKRTEHLKSKTN